MPNALQKEIEDDTGVKFGVLQLGLFSGMVFEEIRTEETPLTEQQATIENIIGKTENGAAYGSAIQLTNAKTFTVTNNTISDVAVNALHIYKDCAADSIVINGNNISAAYRCWNQSYDMRKVESSGNTVSVTNENLCATKDGVEPSSFTLN